MKKPIFKGSAVAIITPFTSNGIDHDKLAELCEFQIKNNTKAIIVAGTTGEASTMPDDEHLDAIRFCRPNSQRTHTCRRRNRQQ